MGKGVRRCLLKELGFQDPCRNGWDSLFSRTKGFDCKTLPRKNCCKQNSFTAAIHSTGQDRPGAPGCICGERAMAGGGKRGFWRLENTALPYSVPCRECLSPFPHLPPPAQAWVTLPLVTFWPSATIRKQLQDGEWSSPHLSGGRK